MSRGDGTGSFTNWRWDGRARNGFFIAGAAGEQHQRNTEPCERAAHAQRLSTSLKSTAVGAGLAACSRGRRRSSDDDARASRMHPGAPDPEAQDRLELPAAALDEERRSAGVVEDVVAAVEPDGEHGDRP